MRTKYFDMRSGLYLNFLLILIASCNSTDSKDTCNEDTFVKGNYILLKNTTLFNGISDTVFHNYSILIKDDLIFDVASDSNICVPASAKVIALDGRLISPGLIESHGHQTFNEPWDTTKIKLEKLVRSGITGIRNMAGSVPSYNGWSEKIEAGQIIGPNIYSSAFFAGQEFFNVDARLQKYHDFGYEPGNEDWMKIINDELDIPDAVLKAKNCGANGIKLYASLKPEWVEQIIQEAQKHNLKVWSHAHLQLTESGKIVNSKINGISHADMLGHTILDNKKIIKNYNEIDTSRVRGIYTGMIKEEIYFDVTLEIYYKYDGEESEITKFSTQIVKMAVDMGVPIVAGSDSDGFWEEGEIALYDELITLVEKAGMDTKSALRSATYNPARLLGIDDELGSISVGKKADIIVFETSPLDDIRNVNQIHLTIKNGFIYSKKI